MEYSHIGNFFDKFKKILSGKELLIQAVADTLSTELSITIPPKNISIKGSIVYVQGSGALKNEIHMRKEKLLASLLRVVPSGRITDIR